MQEKFGVWTILPIFAIPNESEGVLQNGVIAQLVEQRTENPCVPGSIPGDTTQKIRELQKCDSLFLCRFVPCFKAVLWLKVFCLPERSRFCHHRRSRRRSEGSWAPHWFPEPAFLIDSILFPPADTVFFRRAKIFSFLLNTEEWLEEPDVFTFEFI